MSQRLAALLVEEDGNTLAEYSLFAGFLLLAGAGFLYFAAAQFQQALRPASPSAPTF